MAVVVVEKDGDRATRQAAAAEGEGGGHPLVLVEEGHGITRDLLQKRNS
jgi:hypothetical protein